MPQTLITFLKRMIGAIPLVKPQAHRLWRLGRGRDFPGSRAYWVNRYAKGGTSGAGSYDELAAFKAEILNEFVQQNAVASVVEFGCGDGNQLSLATYARYLGLDVSPDAIDMCRRRFAGNDTMSFKLVRDYGGERADLSLSLDVVYHLVEDSVFEQYMRQLFDAAKRFVIVYSSNTTTRKPDQAAHVRHRRFTDWVEENQPGWVLRARIPNRYPESLGESRGSFADFYIFERRR